MARRVEPHRRHHMSNRLFVLKVCKRICIPRNYLIRHTHREWLLKSNPPH